VTWAEWIVLGVVIGANNFAVALALGGAGQRRHRWRITGTFAVFEFFVPLVGVLIGRGLATTLAGFGNWLAVTLLLAIGAWTVVGALRESVDASELAAKVASGRLLVALAAGLSVDNLVTGFALGVVGAPALLLATVVTLTAVLFTLLGLELGGRGRHMYPRTVGAASGVLLIVLAVAVGAGWLGDA